MADSNTCAYPTHANTQEYYCCDQQEWRNVLQYLTAREVTYRSSGVAECFDTLDCARRHLAIVGSGGMFFYTGLREKALGDRRKWRNVLSYLTARGGTWRSSGVAECLVGDFRFEAENVTDGMLVLSSL